MKNKLPFLSLMLSLGLLGQSVVVVPGTGNYDLNGIVYNNSLFFSKSFKLSKFDGVSVTAIPVPEYNSQPIVGNLTGNMIIYNNKLCYNYDYKAGGGPTNESQNKDFLVTYDGLSQTTFLNPEAVYSSGGIFIGDNGSENAPIISNGKLFLKGAYYSGVNSNLFLFDGQVIKKINNVSNQSDQATGQVKLGDWALDYNNELYFGYQDSNMTWPGIAKFNGTSIVRLNTDNNKEYWGSIFSLNNQLYFKINFMSAPSGYGIGSYDASANTISKIPTPVLLYSGAQKPLVYNSQAFITVGDVKLSVFDGVTVNQVANITTNDRGIVGRRVLFANDIYFPYLDSNNKYLLGKYSGTGISLIPNPSTADQGIGRSLIEFNGNMFFTYTSGGINYLAKYNGQNITVMPNPDNGQGVQDSEFVVYGNDIYFPYKNAAGIINMAKYGTTVLSTKETVKDVGVSIFKDNNGFSVVSKIEKITKIEVLDASGREILNGKANTQKYSFEIGTHGVFIVNVTLENGKVSTLKVRN
ncbi:hypothetical protein [Chryseobacterium herbae]|uniref:Uncharacterized protein n=1 Tax=Chryseobacterium herbae TaxID=2976476 RepID=A0ABT2IWT3_9FLAO|nr:hypothetical protein [Chryseobacterium sp. pc1-10]MCT2563301.1 hypothetical protein [Chryseobacterium sp. pc1-10]